MSKKSFKNDLACDFDSRGVESMVILEYNKISETDENVSLQAVKLHLKNFNLQNWSTFFSNRWFMRSGF